MTLTRRHSSLASMRARLHAWTAQVQRFVSTLPPADRTAAPVVDLRRRLRNLRRNIFYCSGHEQERGAVDTAWRRFKEAWDRANAAFLGRRATHAVS